MASPPYQNKPNLPDEPLTGLWKAKWAHEKLKNLVAQSSQVALILIDVDRMKLFNDTFGHENGDKQIIAIAREIEDVCSEGAWVFRHGGEEYGVILNETSLETAREIAEQIRVRRQPTLLTNAENKQETVCTLSLGIAHFPTQVLSSEALFIAADVCLIKCKKGGRLADGSAYTQRNRAMTFGDFIDEFPEQSVKFLAST